MRHRASKLILPLLLVLPLVAPAQQPASLTALDYVQIEQLVHRLHFALDYCTRGGQEFADLFVPGGRYIIIDGEGKQTVIDTREKLISTAGGPDCKAIQAPPRSHVRHAAVNLVIEPTADGARGRSYAIYPPHRGKTLNDEVSGQYGIYVDEYVRTASGWRMRSRTHDVSAAAEPGNPAAKP